MTGQVGGAVARHLLGDGHTLRTLTRDPRKATEWSRLGVDVRQGDFNDTSAVAGAPAGIERAILMMPPVLAPTAGFSEAKAVIASYLEALRQSPPRLVVLSSIGSQQRSGLGLITALHLLEEALSDLPFPTAFVRAGSFLENYTFSLAAAAFTGWSDTFLTPTDRPAPMVATEDIGRELALLLLGGWSGKKVVELGSPMSPDDLARAMSETLGRIIKARAIPREQWTATLVAQGMPPGTTSPFEEMEDGFKSGWISFGVPGA